MLNCGDLFEIVTATLAPVQEQLRESHTTRELSIYHPRNYVVKFAQSRTDTVLNLAALLFPFKPILFPVWVRFLFGGIRAFLSHIVPRTGSMGGCKGLLGQACWVQGATRNLR